MQSITMNRSGYRSIQMGNIKFEKSFVILHNSNIGFLK